MKLSVLQGKGGEGGGEEEGEEGAVAPGEGEGGKDATRKTGSGALVTSTTSITSTTSTTPTRSTEKETEKNLQSLTTTPSLTTTTANDSDKGKEEGQEEEGVVGGRYANSGKGLCVYSGKGMGVNVCAY